MRRVGVVWRVFPRIKDAYATDAVFDISSTQDIGIQNTFLYRRIVEARYRAFAKKSDALKGFEEHSIPLQHETKLLAGKSFMCLEKQPFRLRFSLSESIGSTQNSDRFSSGHFYGKRMLNFLPETKQNDRKSSLHVDEKLLPADTRKNKRSDKREQGAMSNSVGMISKASSFRCSRKPGSWNVFLGVTSVMHFMPYSSDAAHGPSDRSDAPKVHDQSQRAVVTALWCNFLVFSLKCGVWIMTTSHVMLAEAVHSLADLMNQALLAYGLISSRRAPDALHPYGYSRERFVWSLISAVGIFCLGAGATIVHGISNLWSAELPENILIAALVIVGSMIMEGASLLVAFSAVRKGAAAEGMTFQDYVWRGHDPTAVAVMMEDGAAVTGLVIAALSLTAVSVTGNPVYDSVGSILVGNLLGMVAIFLIQRNRHALIGRAMDDHDMKRVLDFLSSDPVVDALYDCKSEVIGPGSYRFKAEIDFNGVVIVQNYLQRTGREAWIREFREAVKDSNEGAVDQVMAVYGEEVVAALGSEVDRLEKEIQRIVPGIRHVDIETHNPKDPTHWEKSTC